nr:hypothetical protein [Thiomicrorhabdus sp.]
MAERKIVLQENPKRCLAMEHMDLACWDFIDRAMTTLSQGLSRVFFINKRRRCLELGKQAAGD